jgi:hypothetical protein
MSFWPLFLQVALDKNTWGWKRVVAVFGEGILREDGGVDRAKLGEIIFNDPAKRGLLNRYTFSSFTRCSIRSEELKPCIVAEGGGHVSSFSGQFNRAFPSASCTRFSSIGYRVLPW